MAQNPRRQPGGRRSSGLGAAAPAILIVAAVAIVVGIFVLLRQSETASPPAPVSSGESADQVIAAIGAIPAATLDRVGKGSSRANFRAIAGAPPLTGPSGHPEVFYLGGEFCPYCAAQRWPLTVALSRFGTFTGVQLASSASRDVFPNTPTLTFRQAAYQSKYLDFVPLEQFGTQLSATGYNVLKTPSPDQAALIQKYDAPPYSGSPGGIPWIDFGNRRVLSGAAYSPDTLAGMRWTQVAAALSDPSSPAGMAILGTANLMTVALCDLTGDQPAAVCSDPALKALAGSAGT